ncbi:MAG: polyribonucleotide nucleotidyltransferase [Nitrospirota bacterium]
MVKKIETGFGSYKVSLEHGRMAKQAHGSVVGRYGDTVVLATVVASDEPRKGIDFFPLTVDYQEKAYAAGKIPGGFFKREGRPSEREILVSRLIDRPIRPLFPISFFNDTQVIVTVLSVDQTNSTDFLGIIAASTALTISDIPFNGPVGAVKIGRIEGEFVVNPSYTELERSDLNLIVAGTRDAVMMVEGGANELSEDIMLEAINLAHKEIQKVIDIQLELQSLVGRKKMEAEPLAINKELEDQIKKLALDRIREAILIPNKASRQEHIDKILDDLHLHLKKDEEDITKEITIIFNEIEKNEVRGMILDKNIRADGRKHNEIRPITCEVGVLPRTHGSALFTRGETQSLSVATLGTALDEQRIDALEGESKKTFMLHYNFPPFSVGEVKGLRGPSRRDIGHGALAERALRAVIPSKDDFPYTLRVVSDILESNGSSSMATVCAGTLSLMDAGVPIKTPVAGIAMGLIKETEKIVILSDISGLEDHLGDMDFKIAGTSKGITAIQMDMKIAGITKEIMATALGQAKEGRLFILDKMLETIAAPRTNLSAHAPRIVTMKVKQEKVREVIGPGGKVIRGIVEKTGVKIDIDDSGVISIASADEEAVRAAMEIINQITAEAEIGKIYLGKVRRIVDFGAFVEIIPNTDGLVHISQLSEERVKNVTDEVSEGDEILVKVIEIDKQGKIRLSRKDALRETSGKPEFAEKRTVRRA